MLQLLAAGATSLWAKQPLPARALAAALQDGPRTEPLLPLFPLGLVLFPSMNLPLHIFEERYKEMIGDCLQNHWEFGILMVEEQSVSKIGCTASISEVIRRYPDGRMDILVRGRRRFEFSTPNQEKPYLRGRAEFLADTDPDPIPAALRREAVQLHRRLMELAESENPSRRGSPPAFADLELSFQLMAGLPASLAWKQSLLELPSEGERLARVMGYLQHLIEYLERHPDQRDPDQRAPAGTA